MAQPEIVVKACAYGIVFLRDEYARHRCCLILCSKQTGTLLIFRGPATLCHVLLFRFFHYDFSFHIRILFAFGENYLYLKSGGS
jgi:hypothetical protein